MEGWNDRRTETRACTRIHPRKCRKPSLPYETSGGARDEIKDNVVDIEKLPGAKGRGVRVTKVSRPSMITMGQIDATIMSLAS